MTKFLIQYHFTPLLFFIALATTLAVGAKNFRKIGSLKIFFIYALISFLQSIISLIILIYNPNNLLSGSTIEVTLNLFAYSEFIIFSIYFYKSLKVQKAKKVILFIGLLFLIGELIYWIFFNGLIKTVDFFTVLESFYFLGVCLYYFYELFIYPPNENLKEQPDFWISTGIFFLFSLIIPLFMLRKQILKISVVIYDNIYSVTFIAYTILFVFITNGIIWKTRKLNY